VLRAVPPCGPVLVDIEAEKVYCYDVVGPFDDHLAEITLPILYVGAAGGTGHAGSYAVTLTASTDVTKFTVQLHADEERALDFSRADHFYGNGRRNAGLAAIRDWLVAHR
jgi:hypothetical protein